MGRTVKVMCTREIIHQIQDPHATFQTAREAQSCQMNIRSLHHAAMQKTEDISLIQVGLAEMCSVPTTSSSHSPSAIPPFPRRCFHLLRSQLTPLPLPVACCRARCGQRRPGEGMLSSSPVSSGCIPDSVPEG